MSLNKVYILGVHALPYKVNAIHHKLMAAYQKIILNVMVSKQGISCYFTFPFLSDTRSGSILRGRLHIILLKKTK